MRQIKTFKAASMKEALELVRRELGPDAVILHTRQISHRRFLPWKTRQEVEITAGVGVNVSPPSVRPRRTSIGRESHSPAGGNAAQRTATLQTRSSHSSNQAELHSLKNACDYGVDLTQPHLDNPKQQAAAILTALQQRAAEQLNSSPLTTTPPTTEPLQPPTEPSQVQLQSQLPSSAQLQLQPQPTSSQDSSTPSPFSAASTTAHTSVQTSVQPPPHTAVQSSAPTAVQAPVQTPVRTPVQPSSSFSPSTDELAARLDSIQAMVEQLARTAQLKRHDEIPPELFHLYTRLIDAEVEDELAREMIFRVRQNGAPEQLADAEAAMSLLTAMIESEVRCCGPIVPQAGTRRVIALVGPTGVGKTTTIAKLAANFRLRDGIKMGLVTVDTYRIAAVEQLRTYAEIIDLPMKVVTSKLEMKRALDELHGLDLILIDTAGRSPRDDLKIQELKSLLAEAEVDEVHLVLSMTSSARSLIATAERFAPANITALILTKLDEAAEMGNLLSVVRKIPKPISYLTTGQDVPDDIEPAQANRIARLILGLDRIE